MQHHHPRLDTFAAFVLGKRAIHPIETVGLGRRPVSAMDHQPDARVAARCGDDRCHCRSIIAIAADVDAQFVLRPYFEHVDQRRPDHVGFLPCGNEDGSPARQSVDFVEFAFVDLAGADSPLETQPEIGAIERKFVDHPQREEGRREQQQFVLDQHEPFGCGERPKQQPVTPCLSGYLLASGLATRAALRKRACPR